VAQALLSELGQPLLSSTLILPGDAEPLNDAATIRKAHPAPAGSDTGGGPGVNPSSVVGRHPTNWWGKGRWREKPVSTTNSLQLNGRRIKTHHKMY
jgi:hypothetical protein